MLFKRKKEVEIIEQENDLKDYDKIKKERLKYKNLYEGLLDDYDEEIEEKQKEIKILLGKNNLLKKKTEDLEIKIECQSDIEESYKKKIEKIEEEKNKEENILESKNLEEINYYIEKIKNILEI